MALMASHKETSFGVGDIVRVHQRISEGEKSRVQVFEGMVIGIKGRDMGKTFTVRRIGSQKVGIEAIFPFAAPTVEKIEVVKKGTAGVHHAKLFFTREQSQREVDKIFSRVNRKNLPVKVKAKKVVKKAPAKAIKKTSKKTS